MIGILPTVVGSTFTVVGVATSVDVGDGPDDATPAAFVGLTVGEALGAVVSIGSSGRPLQPASNSSTTATITKHLKLSILIVLVLLSSRTINTKLEKNKFQE